MVVPCFDEERRIGPTVARLLADLPDLVDGACEVVVVDDHCRDATVAVVHAAIAADSEVQVRVVPNGGARGKGAAVRAGVAAATGDAVLVVDADLAGDLAALPAMLAAVAMGAEAVLGTRQLPGSVIEPSRPLRRRVAAAAFRAVVRALTPVRVSDPQCGMKLYRRTTIQPLMADVRTDGYAFEVEVLARLARQGAHVVEQPVRWTDRGDGKVRVVRDGLRMVFEARRAGRHAGRGAGRGAAGSSP